MDKNKIKLVITKVNRYLIKYGAYINAVAYIEKENYVFSFVNIENDKGYSIDDILSRYASVIYLKIPNNLKVYASYFIRFDAIKAIIDGNLCIDMLNRCFPKIDYNVLIKIYKLIRICI